MPLASRWQNLVKGAAVSQRYISAFVVRQQYRVLKCARNFMADGEDACCSFLVRLSIHRSRAGCGKTEGWDPGVRQVRRESRFLQTHRLERSQTTQT